MRWWSWVLVVLAGCGAPSLQLVESWPIETRLDHPDIPDAAPTWIEMIDAAERTLDLEQFYGSSGHPLDAWGRLEGVIAAIERAAARGVRVRCLFDAKLLGSNQAVPDRLGAMEGVEVRVLDLGPLSGGVQHAKLFVVDQRAVYLGSQNFDWRSLTHVQELGVRTDAPAIVDAMQRVFRMDWALAGGADRASAQDAAGPPGPEGPAEIDYRGQRVRVRPVLSPKGWLPPGAAWDLPALLDWLATARRRIRLQVMSYSIVSYDRSEWHELDLAIRAAAARGVKIELLVADWSKRKRTIGHLQALQRLENVEVRLLTLPQWSGGFVPFARVTHCKYLVVDDDRAWVGTSNWSGDYFYKSRNVGLLVEGRPFAADLIAFFESTWGSEYAEVVDPDGTYDAPRIK